MDYFINGSKYIYFSEACSSSCSSLLTSPACAGLGSSLSLGPNQVHLQKKITSFGTDLTHFSLFCGKELCDKRKSFNRDKRQENKSLFPLTSLLTLSCSTGNWCTDIQAIKIQHSNFVFFLNFFNITPALSTKSTEILRAWSNLVEVW